MDILAYVWRQLGREAKSVRERVDKQLEFYREMKGTDGEAIRENLKFKFDFRKYEPFKEMGEVFWEDAKDEEGNVVGRFIKYRTRREVKALPYEDDYIEMVNAARLYHDHAVWRAFHFGELRGSRAILEYLEENLNKKELVEIKHILSLFAKVQKLRYKVNEKFGWQLTPEEFCKLPKAEKHKARAFLRQKLGNAIQAQNLIKEVFRKPRRKGARSDP